MEAGGATLRIAAPTPEAVWGAGRVLRFLPASAIEEGKSVLLRFHPAVEGALTARWEVRPGERWARVRLLFTPGTEGQCALGYHLAWRKPLAEVQELLLPMMWHRRRLPSRPYTLLSPFTPTPVALAQCVGPRTWGVVADPAEIPFAWPDRREPLFGLMIRDFPGRVQPAIYGPVPGTDRARARPRQAIAFSFRVMALPDDWYAAFRVAADEVFGLRDYRTNVGTSLTEAALNMIDLVMDDEHGGWWEEARAPYQIESMNGSTHASPLTTLSLYRLTGDPQVYRRRALPTMEFLLSRSHAHFSPVPENTGRYTPGSMRGPVNLYGTTGFGGLWQLTQCRTPAFRQIALPEEGIRPTAGYSHAQPFEEWLARYLLTGEDGALKQARALADEYLEGFVWKAPTQELSPIPFFLLSFIPDWEGLLRLYEVTGERRYLDGAAMGARLLMTGIWTQPTIPEGEVTVHPGGDYLGDVPQHIWWKGPVQFRLGHPRKAGDVREERVPAWVPANVGLGFEQPVTYTSGNTGCRMIYQAAWAPNFLRLAAYTKDKTFETYARNA
ncbi:MAG: hypothetical protein QHJ73_16985, partial [Armatimonadota bacterium]|nr:hypothetical protein [Armatimonadota bacterium]